MILIISHMRKRTGIKSKTSTFQKDVRLVEIKGGIKNDRDKFNRP